MSTALTVPQMLDRYKDQIAAALPKHITPDRMARIALTAVRGNQALQKADPVSLMGAIMRASQDGLEPGRTAHLVPFGKEVNYIADYRGLIELARRSGEIGVVYGEVVYAGDFFEWEHGTNEYLRHRPAGDSADDSDIVAAYAVARWKDGRTTQFEVVTRAALDKTRDRSRSGKNGPWVTDFPAMCRKTAVRRLCKWLPQSPELQRAVLSDELTEAGGQSNRAWLDGEARAVDPGAALTSMLGGAEAAPEPPARDPAVDEFFGDEEAANV